MRPDLNDFRKRRSNTAHERFEQHGVDAERPSSRRRWRLTAGVLAVLGAAIVVPSVASAQLTTFTPGAPALAGAVNGNFQQLKTWLEQKVGPVGSYNITTTGTLTASGGVISEGGIFTPGTLTAGNIVSTGNLTFNGISIRTKPASNGFSCGQTCGQLAGGFQGLCLGGKVVAQVGTVFTDDCSTVVGPLLTLTCLCAVF